MKIADSMPPQDPQTDAALIEQALLGCLILYPELMGQVESDLSADLVLSDHRSLWHALVNLNAEGIKPDLELLAVETKVDVAYIAGLLDHGLREAFSRYVQGVREGAQDRRFRRLHEALGSATASDRLRITEEIQELLRSSAIGINWRRLFHSWSDFENAPELRFAIDGFLQEAGVTLIGGLAGQGKTLLMLAMAKALLDESPLFGYQSFSVPRPAQRVLYLIPESSLGPFWSRLQLFQLQEHVRGDRLLVQTLSSREQISLGDPRLLKAAEGADVFLDTAVRFMNGPENDVESARPFADTLFRLLSAGARSITGAHHAPKGFEGQDYMTLENILRGSGDLGAMLCTCWGVRQINAERNQLYVENVKPRDFQPCQAFVLEGRPHLDVTGQFKMLQEPGKAAELRSYLRQKGGRPAVTDKGSKLVQAVELRANGVGLRKIAKTVGVGKTTVDRWLSDYDASQKCPTGGQFRDSAEPDGETPN